MARNLEDSLKDFFAERTTPSIETKAALTQKLIAAKVAKSNAIEKSQTFRNCLLILLFVTSLSVSILGFVWILFGFGVLVFIATIYFAASIIGGLGLTLAFKNGGELNVISMD